MGHKVILSVVENNEIYGDFVLISEEHYNALGSKVEIQNSLSDLLGYNHVHDHSISNPHESGLHDHKVVMISPQWGTRSPVTVNTFEEACTLIDEAFAKKLNL